MAWGSPTKVAWIRKCPYRARVGQRGLIEEMAFIVGDFFFLKDSFQFVFELGPGMMGFLISDIAGNRIFSLSVD